MLSEQRPKPLNSDQHIEVWTRCLEILRDNLNEETFKTWFGPIKPISLDEQRLTIEVPSDFWREYIEEHFIGLLRQGDRPWRLAYI